MTVLVLGDQLLGDRGPLARRPDEPVLLIEDTAFARRLPYHPHKLTLVFSAMRHFRDRLRERGRTVYYHEASTFADGFEDHFERRPDDELVVMEPASHGTADRLEELVTDCGGSLTVVDDERFLCSPATFDDWTDGPSYHHESFYRQMRRETGYLMDGDDPVGGEWNYDEDNRETPPSEWEPPEPPVFEPDETTREVRDWVEETFEGSDDDPPYGGDWADPEPFRWPVTRRQAVRALDSFVEDRLTEFGAYQDAMVGGEWAMHHSLLSTSLNLGLLGPAEVVERAIEAYEDGDAPLNSVEGFVRQVVGWREFVRHVYRREMPQLATANQLGASEPLPSFYWTGDTEMACLSDAIEGVRRRGYAHHIERLMVLSNFGLLLGIEPAQLNRWFHAAYVDAFHWVTTPNVVEMGLYGSGAFASKPYAASANYIDKMSDHCSDCHYDEDAKTGPDACPFNTLYWDFLARNEDDLRSNHRMGLVYSHVDRRGDEEQAAIGERARELRERARSGEL